MLLIKQKMIYRSDLQANPDILYIFGDNLDREGMGGQAAEMRGEPNAFGIATKRRITHGFPDAYLFDNQVDSVSIIEKEFTRLYVELIKHYVEDGLFKRKWKAVIVPADVIGTGLARLNETAPKLLELINLRIDSIKIV